MWSSAKKAALSVVFVFLGACGYTLDHRLMGPFQESKGLYVPVFENRSDETGAEIVFTNALIRELRSRGNIVMTSREQGGYELKGKVEYISYAPTNWTEPGFSGLRDYQRLATEVGITVGISIYLVDPTTGKVVWSNNYSGFRRVPGPTPRTYNYEAASSIGPSTQSLVESYYGAIAQDIMRDVYDTMVELF